MKTAGVVLDFYDDVSGAYLKRLFPSPDELPECIKTAHILTPEEREVLRDEAYALIMNQNGKVLRKFACVDEGNTVLSVLYFLANKDKLPEEAVKTAAANLSYFCEEFGLPIPKTVKLAARSGMARTRDPIKQPILGDSADWAQRTNLVSVRGGADQGRVIPTASQMKTAEKKQSSDRGTGATNLGGGEVLTDDKRHIGVKSKMPRLNENDRINLDSFHRLNPSAKPKTTMVDVTGKETKPKVKRSSANLTALGGRYPLDSMADVQKAIQYFEENRKEMEPIEVHIFAVKTAARAEELGLPIPEDMRRYGSIEFAPDVDFHMANRLAVCAPEYKELYTTLREKRAYMEPEEFAELLTQADTVSNLRWYWGGEIADPYYATFGKTASSWSWQSRTGDFVSEDDLKWLARNGRPLIHKHFSSELVNEFIKDPIAIFESLPDDSKVIIARLAADRFDGLGAN
jgi:hypothetical protein